MKSRILALVVAGVIALSMRASGTPMVFIANPYTPGSTQAAYYSSNTSLGQTRCYTDIDYDGSYRITDFRWWGLDLRYNMSFFEGFSFKIYADGADNKPGPLVYSDGFGHDNLTIEQGASFYLAEYQGHLTTPFIGAAGKYWINVTAELLGPPWDTFTWGWTTSQTTRIGCDDWQYYQDLTNNSGDWLWQTPQPGDLTFEVFGEELVPEPASLTLFGIGLACGLAAIRRRKK